MKTLINKFLWIFVTSFLSIVTCLPCSLHWEPAALGNIPEEAISSGPNQFIARVDVSGKLMAIKLNPTLRSVNLTIDGTELKFESYEVLTNPDDCIVQWVSYSDSSVPEGSVQVDATKAEYVGRGKSADAYLLIGTILPGYGLTSTHNHEQVIIKKRFQALTSTYPLLVGTILEMDIDNNTANTVYANSVMELVGSSNLQSTSGVQGNAETIKHSKVVKERFEFQEDGLQWVGIASIDLNFQPWFGGSHISVQNASRKGGSITVERTTEVYFEKTISVSSGKKLQICTVFIRPVPTDEIDFTARVEFSAPLMKSRQIIFILQALGRTANFYEDVEANTVTVDVKGKMRGRYVMETASFEYTFANNDAKCLKLNGEKQSSRP